MHWLDYSLIAVYLIVLLGLGLSRRLKDGSDAGELILGGRTLTLPAFVASLVSTWYGGILGVGEYSYLYGVSNWLVFGLPYYLAAALFALFLAGKARRSEVLTIPQRLAQAYGNKAALAGSVIIWLMMVPAAYVLMLGVLGQIMFGWSLIVGILIGTGVSVLYVFTGGFRAVVRTDSLQFTLMFAGFAVLFGILYSRYGGFDFLTETLPEAHLTWHGGNSGFFILAWYFIALVTLIEPTFHQRTYAARDEATARKGILVAIACWAVFDFLTTTCGLYARALLPELAEPIAAYPALAADVLPVGLTGLFALALLATVMSTVDSYSFLAASTFGHDIMPRLADRHDDRSINRWTRWGLALSVLVAVVVAWLFQSVIDIWYAFGSIGTPALLIPVLSAFIGGPRLSPAGALTNILGAGGVAAVWYGSLYLTPDGSYWLGLQPIFPGLLVSIAIYLIDARLIRRE
jgi:SSS family solute:Na+ symporter